MVGAPRQSAPRQSVSVVLGTRDGAAYVEEQLRSILAQTHAVSEIIIGDDDSTDATLEIVERVTAGSGVRVEVHRHRPPLGVRDNFADAIARATCDVIALCDQDDVWERDRIERMLAALDGVDLVHTDARLVDEQGAPLGSTLSESLEMTDWERDRMMHGGAFEALLRRNLVTGATVLVRRERATASLPVPDGWIHDEWIAMLAAIDGAVRFLPETTVDYRQHGSNAIGVRRLTLPEKVDRLFAADSGSHARKALRATSLAREAGARGLGTEEQRSMLVEKARHERTRAGLPDTRVLRVPAVLRGVLRGDYRSYSRGLLDIARDLLERH